MTGRTVPLTVEWAYWGKESEDVGYRLLHCSNGVFDAKTFERVLIRYAPGTPRELPLVTISWQYDENRKQNYVALAIYEDPPPGAHHAMGRDFVTCRCFCVSYKQLAAGPVSYQAMYQDFRNIRLPVAGREVIRRDLPTLQSAADLDPAARQFDSLAKRTAAMLLTCKPVCIREADGVGCDDRLLFLDTVMAVLPYGLRSRLSASTWVNSLFEEHKFRLFFSEGHRADDYDLTWNAANAHLPNLYMAETSYRSWLAHDTQDPVAQAAKLTDEPIAEFNRVEVDRLMKQLYSHHRRGPQWPSHRKPRGSREEPSHASVPDRAAPDRAAEDARKASVAELLAECADMIDGDAGSQVGLAVSRLWEHRNDLVTTEQRQQYQQIIMEHRMLREDERLTPALQALLYPALLQLGFGAPLTYPGYCQLEECLGIPAGGRIHLSLLRAIDSTEVEVADLRVRLLMLKDIGDEELKNAFDHRDRETVAELVATAASDQNLVPVHARVIYDIVIRKLLDPRSLDRKEFRSILHPWGYLAPTLDRIKHYEAAYQRKELSRLLEFAYGSKLNRNEVRNILGNTSSAPTIDLFFAVLDMAEREAAEIAERTFIRNLASKRGYPPETHYRALQWLPDNYRPD